MPRIVTEIRVFVASPGDVNEEREKLRDVIEELNLGIAGQYKIVLSLVNWQTDSFPDIGEDAQDVINKQIGPSDIFIGIMWKKIGTPTKRFPSGTIEEFELAYQIKNKYELPFHIMFYFNKKPVYPSSPTEAEQLLKVMLFKEKFKDMGLFWEYNGPNDFQKIVKRHLEKVLIKLKGETGKSDVLGKEGEQFQRLFFPPFSEIPFTDIPSTKAEKKLTELIMQRKNIIVTGDAKYNKLEMLKKSLQTVKSTINLKPKDILYVYNFKIPDQPISLIMPQGEGRNFKISMEKLIKLLIENCPEMLKSKYYTEKRDEIIESQQRKQKGMLENFKNKVAQEGFSVIQVEMGTFVKPDLVPLIDGNPTPFNKLENLVRENIFPKKKMQELQKRHDELTNVLEEIFEDLREIEENTSELLRKWDLEAITPLIRGAVSEIISKFDYPKVSDYLNNVVKSLMRNIDLFKKKKGGGERKRNHRSIF